MNLKRAKRIRKIVSTVFDMHEKDKSTQYLVRQRINIRGYKKIQIYLHPKCMRGVCQSIKKGHLGPDFANYLEE